MRWESETRKGCAMNMSTRLSIPAPLTTYYRRLCFAVLGIEILGSGTFKLADGRRVERNMGGDSGSA